MVRSDTQREIDETIRPYNMGIAVLDVNFQAARPPEEVKSAFDDAIAARENREQYVREAEAYANEVQPRANGQAQRILEEARAYKERTVLEAQVRWRVSPRFCLSIKLRNHQRASLYRDHGACAEPYPQSTG